MALDDLARGFRKRTLVTARLAARVGVSAARRQLLGAQDDVPADPESVRLAARALVTELGALKGLVMKVGQMASYLPGALPEEAQRVLADLQSQSTALSYARVVEVITAELGGPPDQVFDQFEPEPFAAASIGQVHRAVLNGRAVAVKVQYPGIEEVLAADLSAFGWMSRLSTLGLPLDGAALADELRDRVLEECDYRGEARNQRRFARLLADVPGARVPEVIHSHSTRCVLTTALVTDALRFAEFADTADAEVRSRAGEVIFRACLPLLFRHGVFNGDPHPGNYLFHADGSVTFLDFGCVRTFDESFIEVWKAFARAMIDGKRGDFRHTFTALGLVGRESGYDFGAQYDAMRHLYRPFLQRDPFFTFTDTYVRESYGVLVFDNPNQLRTAMPREWLLLNRLQWGLNAVLARLGATAPWPDIFREAVEAPFVPLPSTY